MVFGVDCLIGFRVVLTGDMMHTISKIAVLLFIIVLWGFCVRAVTYILDALLPAYESTNVYIALGLVTILFLRNRG